MDKNSFLIDLSESTRTDFGRVAFDKQSPVQRVFSAIWALESEVNSGGFSSYFSGSEANTASFAPTALREIGAVKCAAIVERALQIGAPGDTSELDEQFMAYPDNLTELLFAYVASHPEAFGPVT
jgi:hypothetical protein